MVVDREYEIYGDDYEIHYNEDIQLVSDTGEVFTFDELNTVLEFYSNITCLDDPRNIDILSIVDFCVDLEMNVVPY